MNTINIHGKDYVPVAERLKEVHSALKKLSITTEVLSNTPPVIRATVVTDKGTFTGISAANLSKQIEKASPYEVAETSAVGRALGFAGYGLLDDVASADEVINATKDTSNNQKTEEPTATMKQVGYIKKLLEEKNVSASDIYRKYLVSNLADLTMAQASEVIGELTSL